MLKSVKGNLLAFMLLTLATLSAGCATVGDQRVDLLYQRGANASGGSGDLYVVEESPSPTGGSNTIQWVLGEIRDKDGKKLGNMVSDTSPADTLTAAYIQEFKGAGYNTVQRNAMPADAPKGMLLKRANIKLDEVKRASSFQVKCKVTVTVEPWSAGKALNRVEYEADYTDTAVTDRDLLASKTLHEALHVIMRRSVPDLVKMIEQK